MNPSRVMSSAHAGRVRRLEPTDMPEAARLHAASFAQAWDIRTITGMLATPGTQAWGANGAALGTLDGFLIWRSALEEADLLTLAVDPARRRTGVAQAILQCSENALYEQGVMRLVLEVSVANLAAIALYRASGYREIAHRPGYYSTPQGRQDAMLMEKCRH